MEKVTANAQLLLGFISGRVITYDPAKGKEPFYALHSVDAAAGTITIEASNGNLYRVSIVQISGREF